MTRKISIVAIRRGLTAFVAAGAVAVSAAIGLNPTAAHAADSVGSVYTDPSLFNNYGYCTLLASAPTFGRWLSVGDPVVRVNREQWVAWWIQIFDKDTGAIYQDWSYVQATDVQADGHSHQLLGSDTRSTTSQTTAVAGTGALQARIYVAFYDPGWGTFNGYVVFTIQRYVWQSGGAAIGGIQPACGGF